MGRRCAAVSLGTSHYLAIGGVGWILGGSYFFFLVYWGGQTLIFETSGGVGDYYPENLGGSDISKNHISAQDIVRVFFVQTRDPEVYSVFHKMLALDSTKLHLRIYVLPNFS